MEKQIIEIPHKTFGLYRQGKRAFIHLKKEREAEVSELSYGTEVLLKDSKTGEMLRQTFWFKYYFQEVDNFIFLVFRWEKTDVIFGNRKYLAKEPGLGTSGTINATLNFELHLLMQMRAYSSFLFITDEYKFMPPSVNFVTNHDLKKPELQLKETFILLNSLNLKTSRGKLFTAHSLFPEKLLYI